MKDKGFTLVELLAVIALLAILVIIAIPNVLGMFNKAKKDSFITEARTIYSTANTSFVKDSMGDMTQYVNGIDYGRSKGLALSGPSFKYLDLSGSDDIDFYVHLSLSGKVTAFYVTNGQFQFAYEGTGLDIEDISSDTVESTVGLSEEQLVSIKDNTVYVGGAPHDMLKLCVVNDKKYDVLKEYYYYSRGMNVNDWNNSSCNTSHYILNGFVNTDNNYNIVNDSAGLEDSSKGCYYPKMNNVCVMSGYASETISGDTMNRVKTTFEAPEGVTVIAYNSSIFKKMNINYSEFLQKNGLFTTSSSDTDKLFYANSGCYFNGERITSGTQVTVYPNNNSSIKCYSNQTVGECMQNSSIPGQATYYGSLGVSYGHNYAVSAMLLVRDGQKYYSAYGLI